MIFEGFLGRTQVEITHPVEGNGTVPGPRNTPKSKIPVSSLLASSIRYQTGRLQTGSCRLVDWKTDNCRMDNRTQLVAVADICLAA